MKRRLCSAAFWSAGERNDPFRRAAIAPKQSQRVRISALISIL